MQPLNQFHYLTRKSSTWVFSHLQTGSCDDVYELFWQIKMSNLAAFLSSVCKIDGSQNEYQQIVIVED